MNGLFLISAPASNLDSLFVKGLLPVGESSAKWAPDIGESDDILIRGEGSKAVHGIFNVIDSGFSRHLRRQNPPMLLLRLKSKRLLSAHLDCPMATGLVEGFQAESLRGQLGSEFRDPDVKNYPSISGNSSLDGLIWGASREAGRNIILDIENLPPSIAYEHVQLIGSMGLPHQIGKGAKSIALFDLDPSPHYKIANGRIRRVQDDDFMSSYLISKTTLAMAGEVAPEDPSSYPGIEVIIDVQDELMKEYLSARGCLTQPRLEGGLILSPLSYGREPFAGFIDSWLKELGATPPWAIDECHPSGGDATLPKKRLMPASWGEIIGHDIAMDVLLSALLKLFIFHDFNIVEVNAICTGVPIVKMEKNSNRLIVFVITENNNEMAKSEIERFGPENLNKSARVIYADGQFIRSSSARDFLNNVSQYSMFNLGNDPLLSLSVDFTSIVVQEIYRTLANLARNDGGSE